jgi:hypothetical protein
MRPLHLSTTDLKAADDAVEKFLTAGVIEQSPTQNRDFLSTFFTIQEETKRRPSLNCQKLNTRSCSASISKWKGSPRSAN